MSRQMLFEKFPKKRAELPEAYKKIYHQHYLISREGKSTATSLTKRLESWMHKKTAEDVVAGNKKMSTLEIGAGTLNQLKYEPVHQEYDIVEPFNKLYENRPLIKKVRTIYNDISEVHGIKYERITSIATFEHIINLPDVVAKAATLLNEKSGHLRVAIPNEGTLLWSLGTRITGFEFKKKYGLDYQILMQYEHVNSAGEIEQVLKYFFKNVRLSVLGFSKNFAFYRFYDCSGIKAENLTPVFKNETITGTS